MEEIWKKIKEYPRYEVSNFGRIRAIYIRGIKVNKILKPKKTKKGYLEISLYRGNNHKSFRLHRVVAKLFIHNPNNLPQVNHKNGNKLDNRVDNLEWCTCSQNVQHAYKTGLKHGLKGINNPCSRKIVQFDLEGNLIKIWNSSMEIERILKEIKVDQAAVIACCRGRCGKKKRITHKGFKWKYYEDYIKDCK